MEEPVSWEEFRAMTGRELLAGAVAGLAEHSVMFPFDTIKTRLQHQPELSFVGCAQNIVRNEPWSNFYRGLGPALAAAVPAHAAYFSAYEAVKRLLIINNNNNNNNNSSNSNNNGQQQYSRVGSIPLAHALSACCAVSLHDATSLPFDVVKQHMQVDTSFKSMSSCFIHVLKREGGLRRIYASLPITIAMNIPFVSTHWVVYEHLKSIWNLEENNSSDNSGDNNNSDSSTVEEEHLFDFRYLVAGLISGSCAAAVSNPCDVIKTNLQLDDGAKWSTTANTTKQLYVKYGWKVFASGMLPRIVQLGPSAAIVMTSYEVTKKMLGG